MWTEKNNKLYKKFQFKDFDDAFSFMEKVARICRSVNHHPKWTNKWNTVEIWLSTHDKSDLVTEKDHELALVVAIFLERIDVSQSARPTANYRLVSVRCDR